MRQPFSTAGLVPLGGAATGDSQDGAGDFGRLRLDSRSFGRSEEGETPALLGDAGAYRTSGGAGV